MMIRLDIPEGPDGALTPHTYHQEKVRIGSGQTNDITLKREGISPYHAVVEVLDGQGTLLPGVDGGDLKVNGTPVHERTLLQPGDRLQIGSVEIHYKLVPFPQPEKTRRISWLEWITVALLVGGVLGQVLFLLIPSRSLRDEIEPQRLVPTPTPEPLPTVAPSTLSPTPVPEPTPILAAPAGDLPSQPSEEEQTPDPEPAVDLQAALREARALLAEDQSLEAEQKLREALRADPSFLPAKILMARLLSDQSNFEESLRFWQQVRREAPAGSLDAMDARLEITSLQRKIERLEQPLAPAEPRELETLARPTPDALPQVFPTPSADIVEQASPVVVENIRMERYAQSPRYDEFRMLTFDLAHQAGTPAVEDGSIRVRVTFFEQAAEQVRRADIPDPIIVLNVQEGLSRRQRLEELSAAYEVPAGGSTDDRSYYGAVIEVFVDGEKIHQSADPGFLLDFIR